MALRAGYKGFKKLLAALKIIRPGTLGIDNDVLIPELNKTFFPRSEQAVLGAKNLLPLAPLFSGSDNGISFSINSNGGIALSGTATGDNTYIKVNPNYYTDEFEGMILNGIPAGTSNKITLRVRIETTGGTFVRVDTISAGQELVIPALESNQRYWIDIRIEGRTNVDGIVIYPMIRLASDPDDTYVPNVMTNRELMEKVTALDMKVISGVDINTIKTGGWYRMNGNITNSPGPNFGWLYVIPFDANTFQQIVFGENNVDKFYRRICYNGTMNTWYEFKGTAVQ